MQTKIKTAVYKTKKTVYNLQCKLEKKEWFPRGRLRVIAKKNVGFSVCGFVVR